MAWFEKEIDYARLSLEKVSQQAIGEAAEKLNTSVREGIAQAGGELREIVSDASRDVDNKLEKISNELHNQRQFTKTDVKDLVDYAAEKLGGTIDARIAVMKNEISSLVQDKVEYFKQEIDEFFIKRQQDLARERRRLILNVLIAFGASFLMAGVSLMYHRYGDGRVDLFGIFRIVFLSLAAGYVVYLAIAMLRRYQQMAEHKKDLMFVTMKYWGVLRPENVFWHVLLVIFICVAYALLFYPEWLTQLSGNPEWAHRWAQFLRSMR